MADRKAHARVLVVTDDAELRAEVERALKGRRDLAVRAASEAQDALENARADVPLVAVVGAAIPGVSDLLCTLAARGTSVIVVAPAGAGEHIERDAFAVIDAYLTSPVDEIALRIAVDRTLETQSLRREVALLRTQTEQLATAIHAKMRAQQELFGTIAHDVRADLAAIAMAASSLDMEPEAEAGEVARRRARKIALMQRAVKRVENLADDLLDLAKLDAGTLQVNVSPDRLAVILEEVLARLHHHAAPRAVAILSDVTDDLVIPCDHARLVRALEHIARVVVRWTPRGGAVRIRASARGGRARLIFDCASATASRAVVDEPLDLGLAVAKVILDAHGGALDDRDRTRLEVVLPTAEPDSVAAG